jgi:hypothetical protein
VRVFDPEDSFRLLADPVAQWLDWEEQANLIGFRATTVPVEVELSSIPRDALEIHVLPGALGGPPRAFRARRSTGPLRAPSAEPGSERRLADDSRSPSAGRRASPPRGPSRCTGPRAASGLFSLKLATDHPHPDFLQPEKTKLRAEAMDAVRWAQRARADRRAAAPRSTGARLDPRESSSCSSSGGEAGFLVRDLRFIPGRHDTRCPPLSLPFVGPQLARARGETLADSFWPRALCERPSAAGRRGCCCATASGSRRRTRRTCSLRFDMRACGRMPDIVFRDVGDGDCATDAHESRPIGPGRS